MTPRVAYKCISSKTGYPISVTHFIVGVVAYTVYPSLGLKATTKHFALWSTYSLLYFALSINSHLNDLILYVSSHGLLFYKPYYFSLS
jgi:hypothetical protein